MAYPAWNSGTGMTWKQGPPRAITRAADARSLGGLGNYMPLPVPGGPEPMSGMGCGGDCGCDDCSHHININLGPLLLVGAFLLGRWWAKRHP